MGKTEENHDFISSTWFPMKSLIGISNGLDSEATCSNDIVTYNVLYFKSGTHSIVLYCRHAKL